MTRIHELQIANAYLQEKIATFELLIVLLLCIIVWLLVRSHTSNKRKCNWKKEDLTQHPTTHVLPVTELPDSRKTHIHSVHDTEKWLVVGASVAGKAHIENIPPLPCQDSHAVRELENSWGIAVVCDGAGSRKHSHLGSEFVAKRASELFGDLVIGQNWNRTSELPSDTEWRAFSIKTMHRLRGDLEDHSKSLGYPVESLACTVIVVVYSKTGCLVAHIGDGRAGYCNKDGDWRPLMTPSKGEEANQTAFITTQSNDELPQLVSSCVIKDYTVAFTLMSDGCEHYAFETGTFSKEHQKFTALNRPYPNFFNPLVAALRKFSDQQLPTDAINAKWEKFVKQGNAGLKDEPDDKTLILGVLLS